MLGQDGSVYLLDGGPKDKLEVAMLPIALVVAGKTREGIGCGEVAPAAVSLFAKILGQHTSQVTHAAVQQATSWRVKKSEFLAVSCRSLWI